MDRLRGRLGAMCVVAWALLAGTACGGGGPGAANVDSVSCKTADDCVYLPPCAERATCEGGICRYEAKRCDTPPAPECVSGDTVYRISLSPGTCQAVGTCSYQTNEMSCASCTTRCLGTCQGMSCSDLQHGCRTAGRCVPGSPPTCFYDPAPATQGCDDGDLCTYGDHCDASGHCAASTVSCASDSATCGVKRKCNGTATCDESYPGASVACDDGSAATYGDHCDGAGHCVGTGVTCGSDPGPCGAVRTANGTATCSVSYPGTSVGCDDGNASTYGDHCDGAGHCVASGGVTCTSDPGPCGATRTANGTASCTVSYPGTSVGCDDGSASTYSDHCDGAGHCVGTGITCASDPGPCGAVRTANGTSQCTVTYPGTSTGCNDGNACTAGDHCDGAGRCAGAAYSCPSDSCSTTVCDGNGGCGRTSVQTDGTPCDVVLPGNSSSCKSCMSGVCTSGCFNGKYCSQPSQGAPYICS